MSRKPSNKKGAGAGDTRAKSKADRMTQSFVACYPIALAGASESERMARVRLSREELAEWLSKETLCR
jgi:hypothetical protein